MKKSQHKVTAMNPWAQLKLTKRERYAVVICSGAVVLFLVLHFGVLPVFDAQAKIKRSITTNETALNEMLTLSSEYRRLKINSEDIEKVLAGRNKDFALFSFLEQQAGRAGVKAKIKHMKPSTSEITGPYRESSVEMKLDSMTLQQVVHYLYLIESPENLVAIKRISIKQDLSNPEFLTVLIHAITYQ